MYTENLQNTVSSALQNQNLGLKSLISAKKSAMYSLYYAEGAVITAQEKLNAAKIDLDKKVAVNTQIVSNNSIMANQLNSSIQASQYAAQSISNSAVSAANTQIASTAITKLAGDIGNIYSIVNAADFGTDIYKMTSSLNKLINTTAYNAEVASDTAMDSASATAQVSSATVLTNAKSANALLANLTQITTGDLNNASQTVAADILTLSSTTASEKLAEGGYDDADIDFLTGYVAYESVNNGLNQGLTALALTENVFLVMFSRLVPAFSKNEMPDLNPDDSSWYPVSKYVLFFAKESNQLTFTISDAENIFLNYSDQCVVLDPKDYNDQNSLTIGKVVTTTYGSGQTRKDTDGDPLIEGQNYVVFVLAMYTDSYKRSINSFDDYLSAASLTFCLQNALIPVEPNSIAVIPGNYIPPNTPQSDTIIIENTSKLGEYELTFNAAEKTPFKGKKKKTNNLTLSYRCILLPYMDKPSGLATSETMNAFVQNQLAQDHIKFSWMLDVLEEGLQDLGQLNKLIQSSEANPGAPAEGTEKQESIENNGEQPDKNVTDNLKDEPVDAAYLAPYKAILQRQQVELEGQNLKKKKSKFLFNLLLAEQVSAGNYSTAKVLGDTDEKGLKSYYVNINSATTDNFGNLLQNGEQYLPIILTMLEETDDQEQFLNQFINAISDIENTNPFTYVNQSITENSK